MSGDERAIEAAGGWRVLLRPGWVSLPTEQDAAAKAISRLIESALRGKPRDELIDVRVELDRVLREQARRAFRTGTEPIHEELIVLFDAIAATLHRARRTSCRTIDSTGTAPGALPSVRGRRPLG